MFDGFVKRLPLTALWRLIKSSINYMYAFHLRKATNGNFALGIKRFQDKISILLGRRAFPGKTGRPW